MDFDSTPTDFDDYGVSDVNNRDVNASEWTWTPDKNVGNSKSTPMNSNLVNKWPTTRKLALVIFVATLGVALVLTLLLVGIFDQPPKQTPLCPPASISDGKCISADSLSGAATRTSSLVTSRTVTIPNTSKSITVSSYRTSPARYKPLRMKWFS